MISVETLDGHLVKVLNESNQHFGIHKLFGFVSEDQAKARLEKRKLEGFDFNQDEWICKFDLKKKNSNIELASVADCQIESHKQDSWDLKTQLGEYRIVRNATSTIDETLLTNTDKNEWLEKTAIKIIIAMFIITPFFYFMQEEKPVDEKVKKVIEAVTVKVVKPVNTVKLNKTPSQNNIKPLTKAQKAKRAVKRNLGFLGLVGSKSLSKVNGGVPQKLKKATSGAGKGGDAGSGGEVLTGLGKGLKKTTVGNTGVAGLGGVGTKGAGGGKGGYGNTLVASGTGAGISAISVASNDLVLDGGLSRYAINATIAKYLSQVRRCYESELNKFPDLEGLVTVAFEIGGAGMLNFSRVQKSSLGNKTVEKCITTKMMKWKFPKPKGGVNVKVSYPFMLRPVGT